MSSKSGYTLLSVGAFAALMGAVAGSPAVAMANESLGVNFHGSNSPGVVDQVTSTAGYGTYAQANWNNVGTSYSGSASNLVLSDGTTSTASLSYASPNMIGNGQTPLGTDTALETQNVYLMNSYLDSGYTDTNGGPNASVTVTNLPGSIAGTGTTPYTVIVYTAIQGLYDAGNYTVNSVTDSNIQLLAASNTGTFTLATSTVRGNYLVFTGITGTTLTITAATGGRAAIDGFQVIAVPEPTMLGLVAVGGLGLLLTRRRRPV